MGSTLSLYMYNGYNNEYSLEMALVDRDEKYAKSLKDFELECSDSFRKSHTFALLDSSAKLYYFSVPNKNFPSFLKKVEKYLPLVERVNVVGNDGSLADFKEKFDQSKINFVEDNFVFGDGLREINNLVNFSFSFESDGEDKNYLKKTHKNISEDVLIVQMEEGLTYHFVPLEGETKYLGHSPMGPVTVTAIFRRYVKNFEGRMKEFKRYREYGLDQILDLSERGDNSKCDILVLDIFGKGYDKFNLPANLTASRFGKLQTPDMKELSEKGEGELEEKIAKPEDFATTLLMLFVENIAQNVVLRSRNSKLNRVLMVGEPLNNDKLLAMVRQKIDYYWKETKCLYSGVASVKPIVAALNAKSG